MFLCFQCFSWNLLKVAWFVSYILNQLELHICVSVDREARVIKPTPQRHRARGGASRFIIIIMMPTARRPAAHPRPNWNNVAIQGSKLTGIPSHNHRAMSCTQCPLLIYHSGPGRDQLSWAGSGASGNNSSEASRCLGAEVHHCRSTLTDEHCAADAAAAAGVIIRAGRQNTPLILDALRYSCRYACTQALAPHTQPPASAPPPPTVI